MADHSITSVPAQTSLPADEPDRKLTLADADDPGLRHLFLAGDVYTIMVPGSATDGRYCLIDMLVNDGGGPPPHRHDFEKMFSLLEGDGSVKNLGRLRRALDCWVAKPSVQHRGPDLKHTMGAAG